MLDTFTKVVDKCIELLRERKRREREVFENVVKPIFEALPPIVDDYHQIYSKANSFLTNCKQKGNSGFSPTAVADFIGQLQRQREDLRAHRLKVIALAQDLQSSGYSMSVVAFAESVSDFFNSHELEWGHTFGTELIKAFEDLEWFVQLSPLEQSGSHLESTRIHVTDAKDRMESKWVALTIRFAEIRRNTYAT